MGIVFVFIYECLLCGAKPAMVTTMLLVNGMNVSVIVNIAGWMVDILWLEPVCLAQFTVELNQLFHMHYITDQIKICANIVNYYKWLITVILGFF